MSATLLFRVDIPQGDTTELRCDIRHTRSDFIQACVLSIEIRSRVDSEPACVCRCGEPDTESARSLAIVILDVAART